MASHVLSLKLVFKRAIEMDSQSVLGCFAQASPEVLGIQTQALHGGI